MSDEAIKSLNVRIEQLLNENAQLKAESRDRRIKGKKAQVEFEALQKTHDLVVKDRDGWKVKAEATTPELTAKVQELSGIIRDGKHDAAFADSATKHGIDPKTPAGKQALADLRQLSGYKAEADEPDPTAIDASIAAAKVARPYLFGTASAETTTTAQGKPAPKELTLPVDASRGTSSASATSFVVTKENLQDLGWINANSAKMRDARKDGTLVYA